jgi:hypothetical protein
MTLTIELPEEDAAALSVKARSQGMSAEQYARQILKHDIQQTRPTAARIREIWSDMPEEVRAKLPADGSSQIDHYVYGLPKRDQ